MTRLFELRSHDGDGDILALIDLDKICAIRVERQEGTHYPRLLVRFVDGHEVHDIVPPVAARHFIDAFRDHLRHPAGDPGASAARAGTAPGEQGSQR